jgi:hypothetical protein
MSNNWSDFNDAEQQQSFDLIPKGTVAKVRMTVKPGGYDDPSQGWLGGYATQSFETGSIFLACEFVVLEGEYARRKLWSNIGLYSSKGPTWGNMGRTFVRAALNSARNVRPDDNTPQAAAARRIQGFHQLDGLEFVARIDIEKDGRGEAKNVVKMAVEPGEAEYVPTMAGAGFIPNRTAGAAVATPTAVPPVSPTAVSTAAAPVSAQRPAVSGKPAWAQ